MKVLTYHESFVRNDALFAVKEADLEKKYFRRHHMDEDVICQAILKRMVSEVI